MSFSEDGKRFATAGVDRTGAIWALDGTRTIGKPLRGPKAGITQAAWIDERRFVTAETDRSVVIRDATSVPSLRTRVPGEAFTVAVDTKRRRIVVGGPDGVTIARARWRARAAARPRRWMGTQRRRRSGHGLRRGWRGQDARCTSARRSKSRATCTSGTPPAGTRSGRASGPNRTGSRSRSRGHLKGTSWPSSTDGNFLTFHDGKSHRRDGRADRERGLARPGDRVLARRDTARGRNDASGEVRQWSGSNASRDRVGPDRTYRRGWPASAYSGDGSLLASTT